MYAGFLNRYLAYFIDRLAIFLVYILFWLVWILFDKTLNEIGIDPKIKKMILGNLGVIIYLVIPWLYYSFFESSNGKATLGKKALGIIVVDANNNKISFVRATVRYWSKYVSLIIFFIGYIMAGFTKKKQALHDIISVTYVVKKDVK
ncbi:RDD family protein [Clostridium botulinum]|uniref:RDD family protein n=1 Tax=Clostridium botulinum TaxID=1491 RepID=A0A6M0SLJ8_CLOBO|nr:RDD family protein [Clostridium botulinum]NFA42111.1 RDD family protein [Clostridium botulinum]